MKKTLLALACAIGASPALALNINFIGYEDNPFFGIEQLEILNLAASQYERRIMDDVTIDVTLYTDSTRPMPHEDVLAQSTFTSLAAFFTGEVTYIDEGFINFNVGGSFHSGAASFNDYDLYSIVLHEMGHILGMTSSFSTWNNLLTTDGAYFSGTRSVEVYGGLVPITTDDGSHWDYARWNWDTGINPSMFSFFRPGEIRELTELDFAALADIGWKVSASNIPEPETWVMLLVGLGIVGNIAAKRRRQAT
ncbi:MAG: PEP-CTERM sorting domain-containing protein [Betaproteobacteria bacterium]|nr:PEP-CTERM sorting domain-containing protein [Betaproteobacteria bacterium]